MKTKVMIEVEKTHEGSYNLVDNNGSIICFGIEDITKVTEVGDEATKPKPKTIIELKEAGFTADEIIEMVKAGVL
jgi:hypothetical protein